MPCYSITYRESGFMLKKLLKIISYGGKNEIASRNGVQDMQYATIGQKLIFSFNKK